MLPAITVLLMLPPACVPTTNADCWEVPDKLTCWTGRPELFSTDSVVAVVPVDAGLKETPNWQESPGARIVPQLKVRAKTGSYAAGIPKPMPLRVAFPVLVSVII